MSQHGLLVVIAGPSGVGKGTVVAGLLDRLDHAVLSRSVTTRPPRCDEEPGVDYDFVDDGEFRELIASGELLEWARYADNLYGTPAGPVATAVADGAVVLLEIEVQGALQVREHASDALLVFVAPPDVDELERRLRGRGTEDDAAVERRLEVAREELARRGEFDEIVVNDEVDRCVTEIAELIDEARGRDRGG